MLAALLATRTPPPPPLLRYSNQLVASITLFPCIDLAEKAAAITTDQSTIIRLLYAYANNESLVGNLRHLHDNIISESGGFDPDYLSDTIAAAVMTLTVLDGIVQSMPVAPKDALARADLQKQIRIRLRRMQGLAIVP